MCETSSKLKTGFVLLLLGMILLQTGCNSSPTGVQSAEAWHLQVSDNQRFLQHADGSPFFYMADTGWLLPEKLTREETDYYLQHCQEAGFNVVQVQTVNGVPATNVYGKLSHPNGYDFSAIDQEGPDGYWQQMDYLIHKAEEKGIYIGMVCIWGGLVKGGKMDVHQAVQYGKFLAQRYADSPNIIWIIGGDIKGNVKPEVWDSLAITIKEYDKNHLMTFHPFGRTSSVDSYNNRAWLDFNMFQSGHRRYGQRKGDGDYTIAENTEEDNWRYVEKALQATPLRPIVDGEPSYEHIPQGLHDATQPRWTAADCRRYAYWSVFAGSMGHTYGHSSVMQFRRPGDGAAYGAIRYWKESLQDPGYNQMKHLKRLMLAFPYFERVNDQQIVADETAEMMDTLRYNHLVATRGNDYMLVYNYTGRPMQIDLTRISGNQKKCWWYWPVTGQLTPLGTCANEVVGFAPPVGEDVVLIAVDERKNYVEEQLQ